MGKTDLNKPQRHRGMEKSFKLQTPNSKEAPNFKLQTGFKSCVVSPEVFGFCASIRLWFKMSSAMFVASFLAVIAFSFSCSATTNEGNQVVIVYNSRMPGSKEVADHYAEKRMVPPSHIFGFNLTTNEEISRGN